MKIAKAALAGLVLAGIAGTSAFAKVPQSEADRLGRDLTPMGAIKAGNAEGTIPNGPAA